MISKMLIELGKVLLQFGLKLLFNKVDTNHDGSISKEEAYNYVVEVLDKIYLKKTSDQI